MRHAVPNPNPRRRKRERSETRKRRGMHSGTCWGRTEAATPRSGRSDHLNGTKDCIKQNGAKGREQTRKGGRTEERRRVLRDAGGAALLCYEKSCIGRVGKP